MSCLYILEINPLPVVSFANIFSHSEDLSTACLFGGEGTPGRGVESEAGRGWHLDRKSVV